MARRISRRAFLAGVSCSTAAIAGCSSGDTAGGLSGPTFDSIVDDVVVGAREVTLQLAGSDVTKAVLIGPDGTAFESQTLEPGVTTVRFPILELDLELFRSSHYTPGEYEIVVVTEEGEFSENLSLVPELEVTAVEQYRDGDSPAELAKIAVTVQNLGTGPTWIYDIAFQESPNFAANGGLNGSPAIPYIEKPTSEEGLILTSGEEQKFLDNADPLAFPESISQQKLDPSSFGVKVGIADGSELTGILTPTIAGELISLPYTDLSVYSRIDLEWQPGGDLKP